MLLMMVTLEMMMMAMMMTIIMMAMAMMMMIDIAGAPHGVSPLLRHKSGVPTMVMMIIVIRKRKHIIMMA